MKRIVLGYDDTESAKRALKRTCELAKALDGYVVVVSVAPALVSAGRGIGPIDPTDPPERHRDPSRRCSARVSPGTRCGAGTAQGRTGHTSTRR